MHPLPRLDEISHKLDSTSNAKYFKQAQYGKDTRAALLALILNEKGISAISLYLIALDILSR